MLLARADAGVETLQRVPVNVAQCLREACKDGRILAAAKQTTFTENIDAQELFVEGDSHALHRLFLILIDNALKYTPPGGSVTVGLRRKDGSAVAEFRDTGIGISGVDLPNIFDRFYRADKARSRECGGIGLGLSIARWVAEAHRGAIEVQSASGLGSLSLCDCLCSKVNPLQVGFPHSRVDRLTRDIQVSVPCLPEEWHVR